MTDRNKEFLQRRSAARQQQKFNRAMMEGQAAPLDRFGVPIKAGSLVLFHPPHDLVFQVDSVEPLISLDPRNPVPPGRVQLVLSTTFPLQVIANMPQMNLIHCGMTDGTAHSEITSPGEAAGTAAEVPADTVPAVDTAPTITEIPNVLTGEIRKRNPKDPS